MREGLSRFVGAAHRNRVAIAALYAIVLIVVGWACLGGRAHLVPLLGELALILLLAPVYLSVDLARVVRTSDEASALSRQALSLATAASAM